MSVSQFGKEGLKIVTLKSFVNWANGKLVNALNSGNSLSAWYDVHLMRVGHALEDELDEFDEDEDMMMDDDADMADGATDGITM
jgi:hypothetical protein